MKLLLPLVCALALLGADTPSPVAKARELLINALDAVSTAQPDVQTAALYHLADNYQAVDKEKAIEVGKQAFAAASQLSDAYVHRTSFQTRIVRLMADIEPNEAILLLRQMPAAANGRYDNRMWAMHGIAQAMIARKEYDALLGLIEEMGSTGLYAFTAASSLIRALPDGDERRLRIFSSALAAYRLKPWTEFVGLVRDHWRAMPENIVDEAITAVIRQALKEGPSEYQSISFATAKGMVTFDSLPEAELFDIMHIVRAIQPKRAEELLLKYPAVRTALEQYPRGKADMEADGQFWTYVTTGKGGEMQQVNNQWRMKALAQSQALTAMAAIKENPDKALQLAGVIGDPAKRIEVLTAIVRSVAEGNAKQGKIVLDKAVAALADIKSPVDRSPVLDAFIEAAALLKDEQLTDRMLKRAISEAEALQKSEANAEIPNRILRENWPSTQCFRRIIARAAKIKGVEAESLLASIPDNDLNLLLRIELAQALLGRPQERLDVFPPRMRR